jgi:mRNA-degrading endonuclease RelE of RelBE toxin-antitoxin system
MRPRLVRLSEEALAAIASMHPEQRRKVREAIDRLRADPALGKELTGELDGWRSLRVARLRIVYRVAPRCIEIAALGPRATIYLEATRLAGKPPD